MCKPQNKIIPVFSYTAEVGGGPLNAYTDWYCCRTCIALTSNIPERVVYRRQLGFRICRL